MMAVQSQKLTQYDPDVVGYLKLPTVDASKLPAHCLDFAAACAAEKNGDYERAFQLYEDKYDTCGVAGWTNEGHTSGSMHAVTFKATPCVSDTGLRVAIKGQYTPKECKRLQQVTSRESQHKCPGCFPQYYYYSNKTRACYSEHIETGNIKGALHVHKADTNATYVLRLKRLFVQGVAAIRLMQR